MYAPHTYFKSSKNCFLQILGIYMWELVSIHLSIIALWFGACCQQELIPTSVSLHWIKPSK